MEPLAKKGRHTLAITEDEIKKLELELMGCADAGSKLFLNVSGSHISMLISHLVSMPGSCYSPVWMPMMPNSKALGLITCFGH